VVLTDSPEGARDAGGLGGVHVEGGDPATAPGRGTAGEAEAGKGEHGGAEADGTWAAVLHLRRIHVGAEGEVEHQQQTIGASVEQRARVCQPSDSGSPHQSQGKVSGAWWVRQQPPGTTGASSPVKKSSKRRVGFKGIPVVVEVIF